MPLNPSINLTIPHFEQEEHYSCVSACLRMALKYFDIDQEEAYLRLLLGTQFPYGTPFANLARAVELWGLNLSLVSTGLSDLISTIARNEVAILFVQTGPLEYWGGVDEKHAVVVTGINSEADQVHINDPWFPSGPQETTLLSFEEAWGQVGNLTAFLRQRT